MLETLALAITAFAATTIDDAFVLIGFFANPRLKDRQIIAGQYLGSASLVAASRPANELLGFNALISAGIAAYKRERFSSRTFDYWDEAAAFLMLGLAVHFVAFHILQS